MCACDAKAKPSLLLAVKQERICSHINIIKAYYSAF